jgi:hypothetical protein
MSSYNTIQYNSPSQANISLHCTLLTFRKENVVNNIVNERECSWSVNTIWLSRVLSPIFISQTNRLQGIINVSLVEYRVWLYKFEFEFEYN